VAAAVNQAAASTAEAYGLREQGRSVFAPDDLDVVHGGAPE
jgi:hypothetical protein